MEATCAGLTWRPVTRAWSAATRLSESQVFDLNLTIRGTVALGSEGRPTPPGPDDLSFLTRSVRASIPNGVWSTFPNGTTRVAPRAWATRSTIFFRPIITPHQRTRFRDTFRPGPTPPRPGSTLSPGGGGTGGVPEARRASGPWAPRRKTIVVSSKTNFPPAASSRHTPSPLGYAVAPRKSLPSTLRVGFVHDGPLIFLPARSAVGTKIIKCTVPWDGFAPRALAAPSDRVLLIAFPRLTLPYFNIDINVPWSHRLLGIDRVHGNCRIGP
jgi:hypothetical protein